MAKYIFKRVLQMIPVFIGVTLILFVLRAPDVLPGDPVRMITGERAMSDELYQQVVEKHGLDKPLYTQYVIYVGDLLEGDLGVSYQKNRDVSDVLWEKFGNTLRLAPAAFGLLGFGSI